MKIYYTVAIQTTNFTEYQSEGSDKIQTAQLCNKLAK